MKWLNNDEKILIELLINGLSYLEISNKLNRTKRSIKEKVNKLGFNSKTFSVKKRKIRCLNCNIEFEVFANNKEDINRKFCTHSCSASFNNKRRTKISSTLNKNIRIKDTKELQKCIVCDNMVKNIKHLFCSNKCHIECKYVEYITKWKNGEVDGKKGGAVSNHIRKYLFEKYDKKCSKCGWNSVNPYTNKIPLEVEHIDGNSENNNEDNLTLYCPNCHSLTKTYGILNKGHGRYYRRLRYKNGQSS